MFLKKNLLRLSEYLWEIPPKYRPDMRVAARVYASEKILEDVLKDRSLEQLVNVATLPGIQKYALAMPDIHEGYGFPIGGIAAMSWPEGVISPGGIGYDINCGVRLLRSNLKFEQAKAYLEELADQIYSNVPSGVGRGGSLKVSLGVLDQVLKNGASWAFKNGYGEEKDLEHIELRGSLPEADPQWVSEQAKRRGVGQLGTLGAGNHFLEVDKVSEIYDSQLAEKFGFFKDQVTVLVHSGSRGLGHQVATDYIRLMNKAMPDFGFSAPDRELVCVPFNSPLGQRYFGAMSAAANFAWANRQLISSTIRRVFRKIFGSEGRLDLVYDVAHNIAKVEEYKVNGRNSKLILHRKGATRSFPGQPVIIPGSMGTASYVMIGTEKALEDSFGSVCHGAGRALSRHGAMRIINGQQLKAELGKKGILVKTGSVRSLAEEAPAAYKDIDAVAEVAHQAGLAGKIIKLQPLATIKG